ncbi:MAG: hypothetical protein ACOYYU_05455 [Chloroflexota bacterium]
MNRRYLHLLQVQVWKDNGQWSIVDGLVLRGWWRGRRVEPVEVVESLRGKMFEAGRQVTGSTISSSRV